MGTPKLQILASLSFKKKIYLVPWIGEHPYIEMLFRQFSNITIYVRLVGKMLDQHYNDLLFSNPGDKVQERWKTMVQICPLLSTRFRTVSPVLEDNFTLKCGSGIFSTTLIYVVMLENSRNNFLI